MTDTPELPQADDRSIVERAKAILLKPANEWPRIAASTETPGDLITRYAVPLAAIGPLATFVHGQVFGYGALGFSWKPGLVAGLGSAVATYVLGLVGVIVLALIADWLAPKFSGVSNAPPRSSWWSMVPPPPGLQAPPSSFPAWGCSALPGSTASISITSAQRQ
jgi:hypothetical protein